MLVQEHAQTAQEFLGVSDHEFMAGDNLQASEKLWGAASHAVMAAAQQRGLAIHKAPRPQGSSSTSSLKRQVIHSIVAGFIAAQQFHANFYHDFIEDYDYDDDRAVVKDFINRVLTLVD